MITSIQGTLTSASPLHAIIELNGFAYEVNIPVTTAEKLPPPGALVKLHTLVIPCLLNFEQGIVDLRCSDILYK